MTYTLALAQSGYPQDGDVLAQVEAHARAAREAGAQLLAFPENLMTPRYLPADELAQLSEPLDGPFARGIAAIAAELGLWVAFTMFERNAAGNGRAATVPSGFSAENGLTDAASIESSACRESSTAVAGGTSADSNPKVGIAHESTAGSMPSVAGGRPYNTAVVVSDTGTIAGSYRKCHLYDAHGVYESERTSSGSALAEPVATPFCTIGLGICYDLRFPELARASAVAGADLLLFPAAWHDGPHKEEHWKTLLRARAIENECYVAGICHAGKRFVERSMVAGPLGEELEAEMLTPIEGSDDRLFVTEIDPSAVSAARDAMPVFQHRRPELY